MTNFVYNEGANKLLNGSIVFSSNTIKARLVATTETLDKDADFMTGIGAGLGAYDVTLGAKTGPTKDDATDRNTFSNSVSITFSLVAAGAQLNRIVIYKFVTNDADSIPISCNDITPVTPNGGDITVTISADGLFYSQQ